MEPVIEVNPPPETDASKENSVVPATETEKPVGGDAPHKPEENTTAPIVATGAELPKEDSTELNRTPSSTLGTKTRSKSDVGRGSNKENSTNDVQNKDNSKQESQEKKKKLGLGLGSLFGFLKKGKEKEKESTQSEQKSTNVADKTRRDDAPESEQTEEARAKQVIVVSTIEDFPEDCQKLIKHSELPREKLEANFQILMNVLHFRTGKIFKTPETVNNPPRPQLPKSTRLKKPEELLTEMTDFKKQYKDIEDLGKGGFGSVIQARCKDKKRLVAIKKMEHKTRKQKAANFHEAAILSMCSHNNIVKYLGCHEIKDELWVIMELMEGGTFEDAARSWRFNEENIAYIARELLKGIAYLHNNQLAHRDLKSANIMMSVRGEVKMIDLGLCADMSCGFPTHMVGSPFWMPPEMIQCKPHGYAVDIWSFAVSLLEIANQRPPMMESAVKAMFTVGTEGCTEMFAEPGKWSNTFKEFLGLCLKMDPAERATAADLLSHPFIKKADSRANMENILRRIFLGNSLLHAGF